MVSKSGLGVSVIICCYNSAIRLPETLKHLALQNANAELNWEIIIVDNASSDDTSLVARKEWGKYRQQSIDFKVVDQPIVGLSNAREKGIMSAKYEYVLFCDDDNWLFDNYVETAFNIMSQDSSIGVLGGCGLYEPELPVNPEIASHTGYYVNGKQTWAETDHWVYGAGATYRKSVYMDLKNKGWQQLTSDRIGDKLSSGGDVEICFMIYLSGYKILADERLLFKHFVPSKRQKTAYIIELSFWLSYTTVLLTSYYTIFSDEKRPLKKTMNDSLLNISKTLSKQLIIHSYKNLRTCKKFTIPQKIAIQSTWGAFYSLLKNRKKIANHYEHIKSLIDIPSGYVLELK